MKFSLKRLIFSALYFSLIAAGFCQSEEVTTITISNARQTDYRKDEETDNDIIVLEGDVELSVKKGSTSSEIKADSVTYDRNTQMLYAQGNVQIISKSAAEGEQTITAGSLIMNTATLEGVFDGGKVIQTQSDAINLPSGSTLVVFSDIFGKSENNTIVFKNSSLTFCDDENPHWHIDATRTWLLPGGEFAFFNAVLFVGPVPVLYFPAFYYPKDELIFNPVFGYRNREGYYFQTTTYLLGRKPLESSSSGTSSNSGSSSDESLKSIYNFMKPGELKQQERQGLILHNLDEKYSGDTSHYIKFMADWYSNLGGMVGIDGKIAPKVSFISNVDFNLSLGFSNVINSAAGGYLPFNSNMEKTNYETYFLGLELPFRYKANLNLSITKPFSITLSMPVYSDPYFVKDFENRSETLDWFTMLSKFGNEDEVTTSSVSSLTWKLATSYTIPVPKIIQPYISSARISTSSLLNISTKNNYYIPSSVTPITLDSSISGTLFTYPVNRTKQAETYSPQLILPEEFQIKEEVTENKEDNKSKEKDKKDDSELELVFPELAATSERQELPSGINYSLTYSVAPNVVTQMSYGSEIITKPQDFKWEDYKSWMYTVRLPVNVRSNLSYGKNLFSMNNTISYTPVWQDHPSTKGYTQSSELDALLVSDYKANKQDIVNTNSIVLRPFSYLKGLASSSITYNSTIKMLRKDFDGTASDPHWQYFGPDWTDQDSITVHDLNINFAASEMDNKFSQSFVFTSTLYPQVPKLSGTATFVFPYTNLSFSGGFQERSKEDSTWVKNPFTENLKLSLFNSSLSFTQSFSYNMEDSHPENLRFGLSYKKLSAAFNMQYTNPYDFDSSRGWIIQSEKQFLPYNFSLNYSTGSNTYYAWFNRISVAPALSTSIVADLIRPTNSYFTISPSVSFKINEFMTITFSSTSQNSVLYRYFQTALGHEGRIPGEQNPFMDLINSFRFDDTEIRKASGFKLKSLNMTINHELHDWDFNMTLKFEPRLVTKNGVSNYDYSPYISIGVIWKPMETMKTQVTDEYGKWIME